MDVAPPESDSGTGAVTAAAYRILMSAFPTGVAVVTACDGAGRPHGMTCTSLSSVSVEPPTLLVCLQTSSGTLRALLESQHFAVNLLHHRGREAATVFASADPLRFMRRVWRPSRLTGAPQLEEDAFATAECAVSGTLRVADHVVVLGRVLDVEQCPDRPLLYGLRQYSHWRAGDDCRDES